MTLIPRIRFQEFLDEWKCTKMSACIEEIVGGAPLTPKDILDEGDFKIIPKKAIQAGGKITISDNCNYVKKEVYEKYNSNHTKKGDLIIVLRDLVPTGPSIGYIVENDKVEEGILAQGVYAFRTTSIIDNDFLIQYSNSPQYRKLMQTIMVGSTQVHIKNSVYMNIDMPHGELREQKKIADFLSSVDDVIQLQEEKIVALEEQKKGVMQKLFNREVRFKADDGSEYPEWEEKRIDEVCQIVGGGTPSTSNAEFWNGNIQWFTPTEVGKSKYVYTSERTITEKGIQESSAKLLPKGSILLSTRATIGEMSIAGQECCTNQGFQSLIVSEDCSNEYIYYLQYIIKAYALKNSSGSTFLEISKNNLGKCILPIPCIKEQEKIVDCLSTYDEAIQIKKDKLEVWKEIKKGLLQQMFV